jgi:hypothetical protein
MSAKQIFRIGALVCLSEKGLRYYHNAEESWRAIIIGRDSFQEAWKLLMNDEQIGWIDRSNEGSYKVLQ